MRALAAAALVLAAVVPAHPASAAPDSVGFLCGGTGFRALGAAEVDGGPLAVDGIAGPVSGPATITCTIQSVYDPLHSDPDFSSATSPATTGVVALPPTLIAAPTDADGYFTLCTRIDVEGGGTFYWDEGDNVSGGHWSTDPAVPCQPPMYPGGPADDGLDEALRKVLAGIFCPIGAYPPLDVTGPVWDALLDC